MHYTTVEWQYWLKRCNTWVGVLEQSAQVLEEAYHALHVEAMIETGAHVIYFDLENYEQTSYERTFPGRLYQVTVREFRRVLLE